MSLPVTTQVLRQMAEAQLQLQNAAESDVSSDDSDDEDFTVPPDAAEADGVSDRSEQDPDWEESPTKSDVCRSSSVDQRHRQDSFPPHLLFLLFFYRPTVSWIPS